MADTFNPDSHHLSRQKLKSNAWLIEHLTGLYKAVLLLMMVIAIGTAGYMWIEDWSIHDAFYMTIITLSTVGYGEVQPLSKAGQLFSSGLILTGMCIVGYSFGVIGRTTIQGELYRFRGLHKMHKKIESLRNHVIICGYGRLASFLIPDLEERGQELVVIDSNPERIKHLEELKIPYIEGNAYEDETMELAGLKHANSVLALLPNVSDNVLITLTVRAMHPDIIIVARTDLKFGEDKLYKAGASNVIAPFRVTSARLVQQLLHPHVNDFLEIATDRGGTRLVLEQVSIPSTSPIAGKTLEESELRQKTGVIVAACIDKSGNMTLSPGREARLEPGSQVIALGTNEGLELFGDLLEGS